MRSRTGPILGLGFGTLVVLIALLGIGSSRRAEQIYGDLETANQSYRRSERALNEIRSSIYFSAILVRDFLLDPSHLTAELHRGQLVELRSGMMRNLAELEHWTGPEERALLGRWQAELDAYWDSMQPLFEWTPQQKLALSSLFLRKQVLPRRQAVLAMADEAGQLIQASFRSQQRRIAQSQRDSRWRQTGMVGVALLLGLLVAGFSVLRIARLERHSERQRERAEHAEQELRRLSRQLVKAQEEERKALSRELHDEVGQALTALRMDLGNLAAAPPEVEPAFHERLAESKRLVERTMQVVRDLAMGLRPSMLDDLGLVPALEWQVREFSRRTAIPVDLNVDGVLEALPEGHRTCVYRVVQEALTNCARHAQATRVRIALHGGPGRLSLTVQDDGVGFAVDERLRTGAGLGLIGLQERVRALGGGVEIVSQPRKGASLSVVLPLPQKVAS
jgi:signal transduction histidine kinase